VRKSKHPRRDSRWASWIDGASKHLEELVGVDAIDHACKNGRRERRDDRTGDEGNKLQPNGQRRLALKHADKTYVDTKRRQTPG